MSGIWLSAESSTVKGELVTIMCYTGHGEDGRGEKHASCALKCAKEGYPLAVLTDDGTLYKVSGSLSEDNNAKLHDLIAKRVVATGDIKEAGKEKSIDAASITLEK